MFEVLVFVYENYWEGDACPELPKLGRRLSAAGFEAEEIQAALVWLQGLNLAAQSAGSPVAPESLADGGAVATAAPDEGRVDTQHPPPAHGWPQSADSLRVYSIAEQEHLGAESLGFVSFLESSGVLAPHMREIVLDRAMAVPGQPLLLDDLKIIVLMVYWSFGEEPDALVLDELCDDTEQRVAH
jgi:Smg protein